MTTDRMFAVQGRVVGALALVTALLAGANPDASAASRREAPWSRHSLPWVVRKITPPRLAFVDPVGLAFSPRANAFLVMGADGASVQVLSHTADPAGMEALDLPGADPLNAAFDEQGHRLLVLSGRRLFAISARPDGRLDPGAVARYDVAHLGLQSPSGMVVDADGTVFILERALSRLVRVEPSSDGGFEAAAVSYVDLLGVPADTVQGLARNPGSGNLFMLGGRLELYETSATGELLRTYRLAGAGLKKPGGLTFAPTGDLTDDPSAQSLYVADGSPSAAQKGSIVELSFATAATTAAAAITAAVTSFTSSVVYTVLTSQWSPPAPDTSDVVYMPATNTLRVVDSEVDEMSIWRGANEWETTLDGRVLDTADLRSFTREPTGVSVNPANGHMFYSDDSQRRVFELNPGPDGQYHTSDDVLTSFSTSAFNSTDPEDVTYDPLEGVIYLADGVNREVYRISPGANGRFDGVPSAGDDVVTHFDTSTFAQDPECLTVNTDTNHLYIGGNDDTIIQEISTTGTLLRTINIGAANASNIGGIGFGPGSSDPSARHLYLVQRGKDNDSNPSENDGKLWELTLPVDGPVNQAPVVNAGVDHSVPLAASATLDGTVSDDGLPNPPGTLTTTWSKVSGPGTVTFGNASAVDTTASFSVVGTYVLRLTASDSQRNASDDVTIIVTGSGSTNFPPTVNAGPDQAITLPASANLDGTVSDDGQPIPPGAVTTAWSKVSGPGTVTFGNPNAVDTTASFSKTGTYVLGLTGSDGQFSNSDEVSVTVAPEHVLDVAVGAGSDDAEESASGTTSLTSSDLELVTDGTVNQTVGIRFVNVAVPSGASILEAHVQFTVDEATSESTTLTIAGQASDNAPTFGSASGNISSRPKTSALVSWSPPAWTTVGAAGPEQRVDVTPVIDEIVHRAGWASGNALALIIQGTGKRVARAFDFGAGPAVLHVEYSTVPSNRPPVVTITAPADGGTYAVGTPVGFAGSAADPEDGNVTTSLAWSSSLQGQIGSGGSFSRSDLVAGTHIITATATDSGAQSGSSSIALTIATNQAPTVSAGPDQSITLPASATLDGTVSDDGLPNPPAAVTTTWSKVSGPGAVSFGNAGAVDTTASFSTSGTYVLRLTASDSLLGSSDDITIVVNPASPTNQAPVVSAGPDQSITLPASANLDGTVSDDGLPNPPATVTTSWSKVSGPGTVTFGNPGAIDTTASFSAAGTYVLRLTASDSLLSASDDVTVTVSSASTGQLSVVKRGVIHSSTDATSYSFAPVTAGNNRLYVVFLGTSIDTGTAPSATSVSGAGLTFTEIGTAGGLFYSGSAGNRRIQAWRSLVGSGATTGSIAINLSGTSTGMDAVLLEFDGVDTSGTNGSGAVVQSASNGASSVTSLTVTLAAFASANSRPVAFFSHRAAEATTEEPGYAELDDASHGSPSAGAACEWNASAAETTPSASWTSAANAGGFAIEIR